MLVVVSESERERRKNDLAFSRKGILVTFRSAGVEPAYRRCNAKDAALSESPLECLLEHETAEGCPLEMAKSFVTLIERMARSEPRQPPIWNTKVDGRILMNIYNTDAWRYAVEEINIERSHSMGEIVLWGGGIFGPSLYVSPHASPKRSLTREERAVETAGARWSVLSVTIFVILTLNSFFVAADGQTLVIWMSAIVAGRTR